MDIIKSCVFLDIHNSILGYPKNELWIITKTRPCNIQRFLTEVKMKILDKKNDNFLIFAQSIDCGYMLEPPQ